MVSGGFMCRKCFSWGTMMGCTLFPKRLNHSFKDNTETFHKTASTVVTHSLCQGTEAGWAGTSSRGPAEQSGLRGSGIVLWTRRPTSWEQWEKWACRAAVHLRCPAPHPNLYKNTNKQDVKIESRLSFLLLVSEYVQLTSLGLLTNILNLIIWLNC